MNIYHVHDVLHAYDDSIFWISEHYPQNISIMIKALEKYSFVLL